MAKVFAYKGIEAISEMVRQAHARSGWKIHAKKPEGGRDTHILRNFYKAYATKDEKVKALETWAAQVQDSGENGSTIFYLEIYYKGKNERPSEILPFRLGDDEPEPEAPAAPAPAPAANVNTDLALQLARLQVENERLQRELLEQQLDEEEEEDEDEEEPASIFGIDESTETGQAIGTLIKHFAGVLTGAGNPVMAALDKIKKTAPEAEALLIQLGTLAEQRPEEFRTFVTELQKNLNPQS